MLMANGTGIILLGESQLVVNAFKILPFNPSSHDLASLKWEPSLSHSELKLDYGELVCEIKVLDEKFELCHNRACRLIAASSQSIPV